VRGLRRQIGIPTSGRTNAASRGASPSNSLQARPAIPSLGRATCGPQATGRRASGRTGPAGGGARGAPFAYQSASQCAGRRVCLTAAGRAVGSANNRGAAHHGNGGVAANICPRINVFSSVTTKRVHLAERAEQANDVVRRHGDARWAAAETVARGHSTGRANEECGAARRSQSARETGEQSLPLATDRAPCTRIPLEAWPCVRASRGPPKDPAESGQGPLWFCPPSASMQQPTCRTACCMHFQLCYVSLCGFILHALHQGWPWSLVSSASPEHVGGGGGGAAAFRHQTPVSSSALRPTASRCNAAGLICHYRSSLPSSPQSEENATVAQGATRSPGEQASLIAASPIVSLLSGELKQDEPLRAIRLPLTTEPLTAAPPSRRHVGT
jgi:hypothetical protein